VGFAIVNSAENRLTDLMFSCRVQGKRVEHAFLNYLLRRHLCGECRSFSADYRKTTRNSTSGKVFEDLGFIADREDSGVRRLVYPADRQPSEERIVEIVEAAEALREKALA
jgi:predicted enzyme involved in methoxymalonyl-ACP biosynthesis